MKHPTAEEVRCYCDMLDALVAARDAGEDTADRERELKEYMVRTGIAEEAPAADFSELTGPSVDGT